MSGAQNLMMTQSPLNSSFDVVALVASAGGLQAISSVLSELPADFPAAIVVLQHLSPNHPSRLVEIMARQTSLQVKQAEAGDELCPGVVQIAPPGSHLLVKPDGTLLLSHAAQVHFVRPSADVLIASLATSLGQRAIAVVLTGSGVDGSSMLSALKQAGGTVIAQDEATSQSFGMPGAAIRSGCVDHILPLGSIAQTLISLVRKDART